MGAKVIRPDRSQLRWDYIDLDALLPLNHVARLVWLFVMSLDLTELYAAIKSREGEVGRPSADPAVLLALWLYATIEGVGSARELARLVKRDIAYRWLAGEVPVNYHNLADFRVGHVDALDRLLTESVTAMVDQGLVSLEEIAVDGTKVRANASRESFKTGSKLMQIEAEIAERIAQLKAEVHDNPAASSRRRQAAQKRAAQDAKERVKRTLEALEKVKAERAENAKSHPKDEAKKSEAKASMTDAEARVMRFQDGAMRPAYNAQIAVLPKAGVIVAIEMTDRRNDAGLAVPMVDDIVRRYGQAPERLLVDTTYATVEDIAVLDAHPAGSVTVYAPVPAERENITPASLRNRKSKRKHEPQAVKDWRERMASAAGKAIYAIRKLIERVNADRKNHGFGFLPIRGLVKAQGVALLHALAHNFSAGLRLREESV